MRCCLALFFWLLLEQNRCERSLCRGKKSKNVLPKGLETVMQQIQNEALFSSFPRLGVCWRAPVFTLLRHQAADGERPYRLHHRGGTLQSQRGQAHQAADRLQDTGECQTEQLEGHGEREIGREREEWGGWKRSGDMNDEEVSLPATSSSSGWLIFMADRKDISYSWPLTLHRIMGWLLLSCSIHLIDRRVCCWDPSVCVTRCCVSQCLVPWLWHSTSRSLLFIISCSKLLPILY